MGSQAHIRLFTMADFDAALRLWRQSGGLEMLGAEDTPDGFAAYLARNPQTNFVAEEGGAVAGAVMAGHDGVLGVIHHLCVDAARQGLGIGSALADAAVEALTREGIRYVSLAVFKENARGIRFWAAKGFVDRGDCVYLDKSQDLGGAAPNPPQGDQPP